MSRVISHINTILEAIGSKPYTLKELSLDELLHMNDYSAGIRNLVDNLVATKTDFGENIQIDFNNRSLLYRGSSDRDIPSFLFIPGERVSQGTSNIYTKLISGILPSWRNVPKRTKSIIGTNDHYVARNYLNYGERVSGKIYIIIPPNDAVLAVAPKEDVWSSFTYLSAKTGIDNMNGVNKSILSFLSFFYNFIIDKKLMDKTVSMSLNTDELLNIIKAKEALNNDNIKDIFIKQNKSTIINLFSNIDQLLSDKRFLISVLPAYSKYLDNDRYPEIGSYIIKIKVSNNNMTIFKILDDLFDPKKNDFKFVIYTTFISKTYSSCEVWTDRPCIFIDSNNTRFINKLYRNYRELVGRR